MTPPAESTAAAAPPRTRIEILTTAADYLRDKGVPSPRLAAEQAMAQVLDVPRLQLYLDFEQPLTEAQLARYRPLVRRLAAREPLQYVLGNVDFRGHRLRVDRRGLIPRPETEELVGLVLACDALWARPTPRLIDVGVGSGCIVVSLALARPAAGYTAIDHSDDALELARENAAAHGVDSSVDFLRNDLLAGRPAGSADAVVANLPYIPRADCESLATEVRDFEPRVALDGGDDGLDLLRRLVAQSGEVLAPHGWIFLEIGAEQGAAVASLLAAAGFVDARIERDLQQRDRFVVGQRPEPE